MTDIFNGVGDSRRPEFTSAFLPRRQGRKGTVNASLTDAISAALARPEHREHVVAGRVVLSEDGRPIRSIITGRRTQVTGSYASRKAGRGQVFESMVERCFFMHCEVDIRVVDYRAQPFRFEFSLGGKWRTYIADCVRLMDNGRVEVVELKSDFRDLRNADYQAKLDRVRRLCRLLGWRFSVIRRRHLEKSALLQRNIELVQQDRLTAFNDLHTYRVTEVLVDGPACFGDVAEALDARPVGDAIVRAMMVARILEIDLRRPLNDDSPVRLLQRGRA